MLPIFKTINLLQFCELHYGSSEKLCMKDQYGDLDGGHYFSLVKLSLLKYNNLL